MRRPRFALPFTVLTGPDTVRLIAGEDFRYTLTGPGLEEWLPDLLASFDGRRLIGELTARLEPRLREPAAQMVDRLYGERVLGRRACRGRSSRKALHAHGRGSWGTGRSSRSDGCEWVGRCGSFADPVPGPTRLRRGCSGSTAATSDGASPWLWATCGPMTRGYVSPAFRPDAGPCLACLIEHYRRLSPAPGALRGADRTFTARAANRSGAIPARGPGNPLPARAVEGLAHEPGGTFRGTLPPPRPRSRDDGDIDTSGVHRYRFARRAEFRRERCLVREPLYGAVQPIRADLTPAVRPGCRDPLRYACACASRGARVSRRRRRLARPSSRGGVCRRGRRANVKPARLWPIRSSRPAPDHGPSTRHRLSRIAGYFSTMSSTHCRSSLSARSRVTRCVAGSASARPGPARRGGCPRNLLISNFRRAPAHRISPLISTGLACGQAADSTLLRALQEVIERDAVVGAWWGRYRLEEWEHDEVLRSLDPSLPYRLLRPNLTYRFYRVDSSYSAHVTVVTLQGEDREGFCFSIGSACRATRQESWEKAILEAVQGRHYVRYLKGRRDDDYDQPVERLADFAAHAVYYSLHPERLAETVLERPSAVTREGQGLIEGLAALADATGTVPGPVPEPYASETGERGLGLDRDSGRRPGPSAPARQPSPAAPGRLALGTARPGRLGSDAPAPIPLTQGGRKP